MSGTPATAPPLRLVGVSVSYGARTALRKIDLSVRSGEFVALAGPNGSGKTTLLRTVLGFVTPSAGRVELFGDALESLSILERARRVAWLPQEESPRDDVRLIDYVLYGRYAFHGLLEGDSEEDYRLGHSILEQVGLADRADDGLLSISGGERQRAVLARALAQTTPLLLLDEPTSHLDIGHQLDLLARVRDLAHRRGVTVVAALHDLNLAARFADRIVVLSRGRCVADGPPAEILSEGLLAQVWGVVADLRREPRTGMPYLIAHHLTTAPRGPGSGTGFGPVHVVGGGGAAAPYLRTFADDGYSLSVGALHLLDTDAEVAEALLIRGPIEAPFAPLGPEVRERHRALLAAARAIVVAPFVVGPSNLANLEDLRPYVRTTPSFLVSRPSITERDFTGGRATQVYQQLREAGAREVTGMEEIVRELRALSSGPPTPSA
ncbi:MAG TPA: ABC transporter ATP-binding protein [Thermoplasmata archaeon]|nr:ABC transporter ATP-binding protein [Thermoplasmata archaeon]